MREGGALAELLGSEDARERFLRQHWPSRAWTGAGGSALRHFAEAPELVDLEACLAAPGDLIRVYYDDRRGVPRELDVDAAQAVRLHRELGWAVIAYGVAVPALAAWVARLEADLGVPRGTTRYSIAWAEPGAGIHFHADPVGTLTIQLSGRKRWWIAAEDYVAAPAGPETWDAAGPSPRQAPDTGWPQGVPADARGADVDPGAVVYVPRGQWHATAARTESVALTLRFLSTAAPARGWQALRPTARRGRAREAT